MGLRMDDIHAPTVASGPTSQRSAANGIEKKAPLQDLIAQKETIEAELSALGSVLESHGVTMTTSLTTFDGYPRADIDVAQIRTTRARIIRLKNDYKETMQRIEAAVHNHFARADSHDVVEPMPVPSQTSRPEETPVSSSSAVPAVQPPFARVNTVAANSPAEQAGLRPGDKIIRFGSVNWALPDKMTRVAEVVQQNKNRDIVVKILREQLSSNTAAQSLELMLRPRSDWGGRGLLGCHLLPL